MTTKHYLAIYNEYKTDGSIYHTFLERCQGYHVLFNCSNDHELFRNLNKEVRLLLMHIHQSESRFIKLLQTILQDFKDITIMVITAHANEMEEMLTSFKNRIKIVSSLSSFASFYDTLNELLPGHINHSDTLLNSRKYNLEGFEKIKHNRQKLYILHGLRNGLNAKQMANDSLKHKTINTYIEQMLKETGCGNNVELYIEAMERGII